MNSKKFSEAMSENWIKWGAMAACLCLVISVFAVSVFSLFGGIVVTVYANGADEGITSAGATFTTEKIDNNGDFTEQREEYGFAQGEMTVTFFDANGTEVLPEANWYSTKNIDSIVVQWNGRAPEKVQMLFTPAGTETAKEMEFLQTEAISGENKVVITADSLHQDSLMGHLQIIINFSNCTIKSELYNVIYDPEA